MRGLAILCLLLVGAGTAAADRVRPRPNLPSGWTWPPSPETRRHGRECLKELRQLGVKYRRARWTRLVATPVVVPDMRFGEVRLAPTFRKGPFVMDCRLARALARQAGWLAALGIRELRFSSIHHVRPVRLRGGELSSLSRHALGLAIDVFEVGLADGRRLIVEQDYWCCLPVLPLAEFYLRLGGGFRAILSPAVDPESHADHLHLEATVEVIEKSRRTAKSRAKKKQKKQKKRKKKKKRKSRRRRSR